MRHVPWALQYECIKMHLWLVLCLGPCWWSLQCSPDPLKFPTDYGLVSSHSLHNNYQHNHRRLRIQDFVVTAMHSQLSCLWLASSEIMIRNAMKISKSYAGRLLQCDIWIFLWCIYSWSCCVLTWMIASCDNSHFLLHCTFWRLLHVGFEWIFLLAILLICL